MPCLVLASQNPGKLREMTQALAGLPLQLQAMPPGLEIAETGDSFRANALLKARGVAAHTGQWAIADDSGLAVAALGGAPGIYSARYGHSDGQRIDRLLRALANQQNRRAQFVCALVVVNPQGEIQAESEGICAGEILAAPRGSGGFGYDPVFYYPPLGKTFAEMDPLEKQRVSHRGRAIATLVCQLQNVAFC